MATWQNLTDSQLMTVLDPRGQPTGRIKPMSLAPRPNSLDGKTVYLVDIGFGGGYEFLQEMKAWLAQRMPAVKTVLTRKPGIMFLDAPDLWAEIKDKGHAVIFGVGG